MIKEIRIGNFKPFHKTQKLELRPLTLLFGPNSSGKSSIIQSLAFAHEALQSNSLNVRKTSIGGQSIDLGGFHQFLFKQDRELTLKWGITNSLDLDVAQSDEDETDFFIDVEAKMIGENPRLRKVTVGNKEHNLLIFADNNGTIKLESINRNHPWVSRLKSSLLVTDPNIDELLEKEPGKFDVEWEKRIAEMQQRINNDYSISNEGLIPFLVYQKGEESFTRDIFVDYLNSIKDNIEALFEKLIYLGPLRCFPSRYFGLEGLNHMNNLLSSGENAWYDLLTNSYIRTKVNDWLSAPDRLRTPYLLKVLEIGVNNSEIELSKPHFQGKLLSLIDQRSLATVTHRDVGFGVSQIIPVLVNSFGLKGNLIAIEQPEIHVHPALQAELADVFIESARKNGNTFLIETHSEHLILRILRRIRETYEGELPEDKPPITPDQVAVYYIYPESNGARIYSIPITPDGDFAEPWPEGFFPERAKELF